MVFCFPCKSVGKHFNEDNTPPKPRPSAPATTTNGTANGNTRMPASDAPPTIPAPELNIKTDEKPTGPKVAIVIYSMYGHIAASKCTTALREAVPSLCTQWLSQSRAASRRQAAKPPFTSTFPLTGCRAFTDPHTFLITRIPETLPQDVLEKMHAPPKPAYPVIAPTDLPNFDAFLFGIPTRFGNFPAQWKVRYLRVSCYYVCRYLISGTIPQ